MGIPGLDRQAMEAERLERAKKRTASSSESQERPPKLQRIQAELPPRVQSPRRSHTTHDASPAKLERVATSSTEPLSDDAADEPVVHKGREKSAPKTEYNGELEAAPQKPAPTSLKTTLRHPCGAVKKTWAFGHDRHNDIKIEEVLQKNDLQIAVLSSWQLDFEWVASKLNLDKTKLWLVMQARDSAEASSPLSDPLRNADEVAEGTVAEGGERMVKVASHMFSAHLASGLFLHALEAYAAVLSRISADHMISYDWGEGGAMENTVFLVDLPRMPAEEQGMANATLTPFADELLHFIDAQGIDQDFSGSPIAAAVRKFDFSNTKHLAFVHNIYGSHLEEDAQSTGFPLLAKSIRALGLESQPSEPMQVDFAASSIGALTTTRFEEMYRALRGKVIAPNASAKKVAASQTTLDGQQPPLSSRFRVVFPSHDTVKNSKNGEAGAGTIFMSHGWDKTEFPKSAFRDYISARPGLLSHNKMILARTPKSAYLYTGSANFSSSAWGNLTWGRAEKCAKLTCANWECGVVIRVKGEGDVSKAADGEKVLPLEVFKDTLDIPFTCPSRRYEDDLRPWIQKRGP
ncbi:MAG: hypothetical protein M1828_005248 [Chrysothrix sp. TS-e1954]|nr:MAG: hypothetical protein M1828_005248 [Chrysothrix sp. TS-e1954]